MHVDRAVVTGASGLVGRALMRRLPADARALPLGAPGWRERIAALDWRGATVFHLAARVHRAGGDDERAYEEDNVEKTCVLAQAAASGGARRLVFASSIKVNGESTAGCAFTAADEPHPHDAYARSKLAAERALRDARGLEWVALRPPLVFGPGAGGNLSELLRHCDSPWPLPFGAVHNRRSFIDVEDLAALLVAAALHPRAAGRVFTAAHPQPFSTRELVALVRNRLRRPVRLVPVPPAMLRALARVTGQRARLERLLGDLEVDASEAEQVLGWRARVALDASVAGLVDAYVQRPR